MSNFATAPSPAEVSARVAGLRQKIAARISEAEKLRRLPDQTVADFLEAGLHKLMQPRRYGGWACGWESHIVSALELGKGDGSQGWALTFYSEHAQIAGSCDPQAQDEIWQQNPNALIAGSRTPAGQLVPKNGDYVVSGKWQGCAGIDQATWLLGSGYAANGDSRRRLHFLVPKSAATVVDDWQVAGLSGAGAKSFTLNEVLVPGHRVLEQEDYQEGTGPGARVNTDTTYKYPRADALFALAAVPVGIAWTMLESFIAVALDTVKRGRRVENNFTTSLRIGESKAEIDAALLALVNAARTTTDMVDRGESPTLERRALNSLQSTHAVALATRAADRLFASGGAKAIMLSNPLQRYLLDIHAIAAQPVFNWDKRVSRYGRLRLGESID